MSNNSNGTNGKKKLVGAIVALILALLGGGGYYTSTQDTASNQENISQQIQMEYEQNQELQQEAQKSQEEQNAQEEQKTQEKQESQAKEEAESEEYQQTYYFRNKSLLESHYEKHGIEMGFDSAQAYETAADKVVSHPDVLHKKEAEDGDDVYYVEDTNEFVVIAKDGYIRTYFNPSAGIDYYNRQ